MSTAPIPASPSPSPSQALAVLESALGMLAAADTADLPAEILARGLRALERADAVGAAVRGRFLEAFDAQDGPVADGQRTARTWLVHATRVTKGQAAEHKAVQSLARAHPVLVAALAEGWVITKVGGAAGGPVDPAGEVSRRARRGDALITKMHRGSSHTSEVVLVTPVKKNRFMGLLATRLRLPGE